FFFSSRRRHTRSKRDWSSDVCSSDLAILVDEKQTGWSTSDRSAHLAAANIETRPIWKPMHLQPVHSEKLARTLGVGESLFNRGQIGRASCRERVEKTEGVAVDKYVAR